VTARPGTGKFVIVATPFSDPQESQSSSWLSPFRILQRRSDGWDVGDVVAVISPFDGKHSPKAKELIVHGGEERPVWVLTSKNLMKWNVNLEGGEQVCYNC
jgi:nuclear pore complex protein Nup133